MAATPPQAYLEVRHLVKRFKAQRAVDDLSFCVYKGEFVTLLGPSGCGKTTTLMCLAGLHRPDAGEIWLDGVCLTDAARGIFCPPERRGIGMVFQSYAIWPHMTVAENVAYPLEVRRVPAAERQERVHEALRRVRLLELAAKPATQLSGGQQQRVALARALVFNPRLLLFDEPLSNLDAGLRQEMRLELKRLQETLGITSLYVTHDQSEALVLSDRILTLNQGRLEQEGEPRTLYTRPRTRFVAHFLGTANLLPGTVTEVSGPWHVVAVDNGQGCSPFRCEAVSPLAPGAAALVVVRPEHVRLHASPPPRPADNSVAGEVVASVFLGPLVDCRVQWGEVEWKVQLPRGQRPPPGTRVWLSMRPQHCLCLPA